jgi:hypothetical protein
MYSLNRVVFISSLNVIAVIIGFRVLVSLTPLEYSSPRVEAAVNTTTGICIPLAIVLTLTRTLRDKESLFAGIGKVALTLFVALFSLMIIIVASFNFCGWSDKNTVYYNNQSPQKVIVVREYGCGIFDSGYNTKEVLMVKPFIPGLNWTTKVDTLKNDNTKWSKFDNSKPLTP